MMLSAKITIGGPRFPPGLPRWKQQLTATLAPHLLGCLYSLGLRPNEQAWGVGHGWVAFSRGSTGTRPVGGRTLRGGKKGEERESRKQPRAAVEHEHRSAEHEQEYDGERSAAMLGFYFVLSPLLRTVLVLVLAAPPIPR